MKTDDIKKMGLAYVQVLEKSAMDPVGKADADIDNDGDVDKSDKYLHNRRKAISKAMKKEEVEQVDESSDPRRVRDELKSQGKHKEAGEHAYKHGLGRSYGPHFGMRSSKNSAEMEFHKGYDHAKAREDRAARLKNEEVELEEARSWFMQSDHDDFAKMTPEQKKDRHQRLLKLTKHSDSHIRSFAKAAANEFKSKYMNEEVEQVDELSNKTVDSYWKKASAQIKNPKTDLKTYDKRVKGLMTVAMKKEEVEQIDELKKSTIGSYINKAAVSKDKASGSTLTDTRAGKYRDAKTFAKRSKGLHTAFDKILGKARINAKEEVEQSKWPIYSRILEKRDMHVKGATPPEPIDSKASKGEKDFVNMHGGLNGNDSGIDGAKAAADTAKAAAAQIKVSPKRPNDQTIGDKTMPKPKS